MTEGYKSGYDQWYADKPGFLTDGEDTAQKPPSATETKKDNKPFDESEYKNNKSGWDLDAEAKNIPGFTIEEENGAKTEASSTEKIAKVDSVEAIESEADKLPVPFGEKIKLEQDGEAEWVPTNQLEDGQIVVYKFDKDSKMPVRKVISKEEFYQANKDSKIPNVNPETQKTTEEENLDTKDTKVPEIAPTEEEIDKYKGMSKEQIDEAKKIEKIADEMGVEAEQAKAILAGIEKKAEAFDMNMEKKHGTFWGRVNMFFKKNYLARTAFSTAMGAAANVIGGQAWWAWGIRGAMGAFFGKQAGESLWGALKLRGISKEKDDKGNVDWAKMVNKLAELHKSDGGEQILIDMLAKGEIKFSDRGEKINSSINEKILEAQKKREESAAFPQKAFEWIKNKWKGTDPKLKLAITLGVFGVSIGASLLPGVNIVAGSIAAKIGLAKLGAVTGAGLVKYGMLGFIGGSMSALNSEKRMTQDVVDDSRVLEKAYIELCRNKSPEQIQEMNKKIQEKVGQLESDKGKAGWKGMAGGIVLANTGAIIKSFLNHGHVEASQAAAAAGAGKANTEQFDINKPLNLGPDNQPNTPRFNWPDDNNNFDINKSLGLGSDITHPGAGLREAAQNLHGSDTLADELTKSGGKFDSSPGGGERLVHKIVEGLQGKGQLGSEQPGKVEAAMIAQMKSDGVLNPDGSIRNYEIMKDLNPYAFTHRVIDQMNNPGAGPIFQPDGRIPSAPVNHEAFQDRMTERVLSNNGFVEMSGETGDRYLQLDQKQAAELLDPKNKFFSEEVIGAIKRVTDGDPNKLFVSADDQGKWQIKFMVGDNFVGHEVWNNGQHQNIEQVLNHTFVEPKVEPNPSPSTLIEPATPTSQNVDAHIDPTTPGQQIDAAIQPNNAAATPTGGHLGPQTIDAKIHPFPDQTSTPDQSGAGQNIDARINVGQPISPEAPNNIINPENLSVADLQNRLDSLHGPQDVPLEIVQKARIDHPSWDATRIYQSYRGGLEMAINAAKQTK